MGQILDYMKHIPEHLGQMWKCAVSEGCDWCLVKFTSLPPPELTAGMPLEVFSSFLVICYHGVIRPINLLSTQASTFNCSKFLYPDANGSFYF